MTDTNIKKIRDRDRQADKKPGIVFVIIFFLMIIVPILCINTETPYVAVIEKRYLADFPDPAFISENGLSAFKNEFSAAMQDRIGLRDVFIRSASAAKLYVLRRSPNENVMMGKGGWFFFRGQNNIEIGMGTFKFQDEFMPLFAENQQAVSDYYAAKGIVYFYMPTPSKASVYPEYLPGNIPVQKTLIDQVTDSVKAYTDVNVVDIKDYIVSNKDMDILYLKQDFHWNTLGSYLAYKRIIEEMNDAGVLKDAKLIDIEIARANAGPGEANDFLGGILADEYAPSVIWDGKAKKVESGDFYEHIKTICNEGGIPGERVLTTTFAMYENPNAEAGTLLIYGDSMMDDVRRVPEMLAEHFRLVVNVGRIQDIYERLDDELNPAAVLLQRSERFLYILETVPES